MRISKTYVGTLNGVSGMWCGFKPDDAEITEVREILLPDEGQELEKDGVRMSSVWLKDGDKKSNYKEVDAVNDDDAV